MVGRELRQSGRVGREIYPIEAALEIRRRPIAAGPIEDHLTHPAGTPTAAEGMNSSICCTEVQAIG
jgi:hypothetical protein